MTTYLGNDWSRRGSSHRVGRRSNTRARIPPIHANAVVMMMRVVMMYFWGTLIIVKVIVGRGSTAAVVRIVAQTSRPAASAVGHRSRVGVSWPRLLLLTWLLLRLAGRNCALLSIPRPNNNSTVNSRVFLQVWQWVQCYRERRLRTIISYGPLLHKDRKT